MSQKADANSICAVGADAAADAAMVIVLTAVGAAFAGIPGIDTSLLNQSLKIGGQTRINASQLVQADLPQDEQVGPAA